jgi:hypothetical protein
LRIARRCKGHCVRPACKRAFVASTGRRPPHRPLVKKRGRPNSATRTKPVEVRNCSRHGATEFGLYGATPRTRAWKCKRCVAERVTRRHQRLKQILVEEAGGCCVLCGYDRCIVSLQFHHVDPAQKEFALSTANGRSLAAFQREGRKCVLVCANCHGEIESGMTPSPPAGARYGERWPESPPQMPGAEAKAEAGAFTQLGLAEAGGDAGVSEPSGATGRSGTAMGRSRASRRR